MCWEQVTDVDGLRRQFASLEEAASAGNFWDDQRRAQATLQQMSEARSALQEMQGFQDLLADVDTALELAEIEVYNPA
jgi:peptide chain release factor 2